MSEDKYKDSLLLRNITEFRNLVTTMFPDAIIDTDHDGELIVLTGYCYKGTKGDIKRYIVK